MGQAKLRGTYAERKANPTNKTERKPTRQQQRMADIELMREMRKLRQRKQLL